MSFALCDKQIIIDGDMPFKLIGNLGHFLGMLTEKAFVFVSGCLQETQSEMFHFLE